MFLLLRIYKPNPLLRGLNVETYNGTINKKHNDALLYEVGVNRECFNKNTAILAGTDKSYYWAVMLTMIAIAISITLLTLNMFFKPTSSKVTIEISTIQIISSNNKT